MAKRLLTAVTSLGFCLAALTAGTIASSPAAGASALPRIAATRCVALQDDTTIAVKMTSAGRCYTFTAVTNQHLTLAITKPVTSPAGSCVQMIVTDASNNQDASTEFSTTPTDINFTPPAAEAGKTTVTIEPDSSFCTPATSATMTLTYATDVTGALTSGKTVSSTVPYEGQNADFTFDGVTGHHVTVAVTNPLTSPTGSCLQIAAYNTSNFAYASAEFSTSPTDINFTPTDSGLITVVVSPDSSFCTAASSSSFSLTYAKDVAGTLESGVPVKVDLKYEGQNGVYKFTAVANQAVSLAVANPVTSPAGSCLQLAVTDASNYEEAQTEFSTQPDTLDFTPTPAEAGKTTVTVEPDSSFCTPASAGTLTLTYTAG